MPKSFGDVVIRKCEAQRPLGLGSSLRMGSASRHHLSVESGSSTFDVGEFSCQSNSWNESKSRKSPVFVLQIPPCCRYLLVAIQTKKTVGSNQQHS